LNRNAEKQLDKFIAYLDVKYPKGYDRLFPRSYTTAWRMVKRVGERAKVDVHPHMFRHTSATEMIRQKIGIETVALILGHESLDTTRKYTKIADQRKVEAVRELDKSRGDGNG
jgi:integrase